MRKKFSLLASFVMMLCASSVAFAQDATTAGGSDWLALASGLSIAIAAFGGAMGQGRTAAGALEGMARNPSAADRLFTPMIIGLVLIESLVIYALVVAILLWLKIPG